MARTSEFSSGLIPPDEANWDSHRADSPAPTEKYAPPAVQTLAPPSNPVAVKAAQFTDNPYAAVGNKDLISQFYDQEAAKPKSSAEKIGGELVKAATVGLAQPFIRAGMQTAAGLATTATAAVGAPKPEWTTKPKDIDGINVYKPNYGAKDIAYDAAQIGADIFGGEILSAAGKATKALSTGTNVGRALDVARMGRKATTDATMNATREVPVVKPATEIDPGISTGVIPKTTMEANPNYVPPGKIATATGRATSAAKAAVKKPTAAAVLATEAVVGSGGAASAKVAKSAIVRTVDDAAKSSASLGSWTPKAATAAIDTSTSDVAETMRAMNAAKAAASAEKVNPWLGNVAKDVAGPVAMVGANVGAQFKSQSPLVTPTTAKAPSTANTSTTTQAPTTNPSPTTNTSSNIDVSNKVSSSTTTQNLQHNKDYDVTKSETTTQNLQHNKDYDVTKTPDVTKVKTPDVVQNLIPAPDVIPVPAKTPDIKPTSSIGDGGDGGPPRTNDTAKEEPKSRDPLISGGAGTTPTDFAKIPYIA